MSMMGINKWVYMGINEPGLPLRKEWKPSRHPALIWITGKAPSALGYASTKWLFNLNKIFNKDARIQMTSSESKWAQISLNWPK